MRVGESGAAKSQRFQTTHGIAKILRGNLETQIAPIEIVSGECPFDQILGWIPAHGAGEQSQQRLDGGTGHGRKKRLMDDHRIVSKWTAPDNLTQI